MKSSSNLSFLKKAAVFALVGIALPAATLANSVEVARSLLQRDRGPLGPNQLQHTDRRILTSDLSGTNLIFKAAYRTPDAQNLARNNGLYLGNLFTTNYYELQGEFMYGNPDSNHPLNHVGFVKVAASTNRRATTMIQSWILEKHYIQMLPESNLAKVFNDRAMSDVESERAFADYFFDIYLISLTAEPQFLLAAQLMKYSPIEETASFTRARDLATQSYDRVSAKYGYNHSLSKKVYDLRNMVHNHMSPAVIPQITRFLNETPEYEAAGFTELRQIREALIEYYSIDPNKLLARARGLQHGPLEQALIRLQSDRSEAALLEVSKLVVNLKSEMVRHESFRYRSTWALQFILSASQVLSRLALEVRDPTLATAEILLNSVYGEGFLITDNRQYFQTEIQKAQTPGDVKRILLDIVDISNTTLTQAMGPALNQWYQIEPRVRNFTDSAVKSSSLNALSIFAARIP